MHGKILLLFTFISLCMINHMQAQTKQLARANKLYQAKQYSEAAKLYEAVLAEKPSLSTKTKLAFCYRVNNKTEIAEKLYAEIVPEKRAKAITYFYYAEMLMSNGKYGEAKQWFLDYEKLKPEDERARIMAEACDKVASIEPYFAAIKIDEFSHNSDADDSAPILWGNDLIFSSDRSPGAKFLKQKSGFTGRDFINLFHCKKGENGVFEAPKIMTGKLNELNKNTSNASFTGNGIELFFSRNHNQTSRKQAYNMALFRVEFAGGNRWKNLKLLEFCSPEYNFMHPAISPNGKFLVFVSDKPKGYGGTDLWFVERTSKGWSRSKNIGARVNTVANEGYPFIDNDGRLYFCSKGHIGFGGFDIFVSERDSLGEWQNPVNLGRPINSSMDDISIFIDKNREGGCFTSNRSGGDDDVFLFEILNEVERTKPPIWEAEKEEELVELPAEAVTILEEIKLEDSLEMAAKVIANAEDTTILENPIETQEVTEIIEASIDTTNQIKDSLEVLTETTIVAEPAIIDSTLMEFDTTVADTANIIPVSEKIKLEVLNLPSEDTLTIEPNIDSDTSSQQFIEEHIKKEELPTFYYLEELLNRLNNSQLDTVAVYRIDSVLFDYEVYQITPVIARQLDKIIQILEGNPKLKIELSAHTESQGEDYNNLVLSRYRAEAAVAYIEKKGVDRERVLPKGYGETQLLNDCKNGVPCSKEKHLYNQRLELRVLAY